jgi:hypothetical protein
LVLEANLTINGLKSAFFRQVAKRDVIYAHWIFEEGVSFIQRGQLQDPNGDGINNALAYAFGMPAMGEVPAADLARLPKAMIDLTAADPKDHRGGVEFRLPKQMQADVTLIVEASSTLAPGSWSEVARWKGSGAWQVFGVKHPVVRLQDGGSSDIMTVTEDLEAQRFYRLRALVSE